MLYRSDGLILNYFEVARSLVITWDPTGTRDKNASTHHQLDFSAIVLGFCWKGDFYILDFRLLREADPQDQQAPHIAQAPAEAGQAAQGAAPGEFRQKPGDQILPGAEEEVAELGLD
jgi:hypothetical protein